MDNYQRGGLSCFWWAVGHSYSAIKQLYETCKKQSKHLGLQEETRKLGMNYSALYELNSDIVNFRIKMPKNEAMVQALHKLSEADARIEKTA